MKGDPLYLCRTKVRYASRDEARRAIQGIVTRLDRRLRQRNLCSYRCRHCLGYHITSA